MCTSHEGERPVPRDPTRRARDQSNALIPQTTRQRRDGETALRTQQLRSTWVQSSSVSSGKCTYGVGVAYYSRFIRSSIGSWAVAWRRTAPGQVERKRFQEADLSRDSGRGVLLRTRARAPTAVDSHPDARI